MIKDCIVYRTVRPIGISEQRITQAVSFVCTQMNISSYMVSIHLIGKRKMTTLNSTYRGIFAPTDVLSFSAQEGDSIGVEQTVDYGDIFICPEYIQKQATYYGVSFEQEFFRMVVHGLLHLFGYDHEKEKDAERMFGIQETLLNGII